MTFRGTFRDGVIVPGGEVNLPEGTKVDIVVAEPRRSPKAKPSPQRPTKPKKRKKSLTAEERIAIFMKSFGISKDRPDWKGRTTQDIARELRQRASGNWAQKRKSSRG